MQQHNDIISLNSSTLKAFGPPDEATHSQTLLFTGEGEGEA